MDCGRIFPDRLLDMIEKIIKKMKIQPHDPYDAGYWLTRTPEERLSAVEIMRRDHWKKTYADESGFPRVYKVIKHS